MDIRIKEAAWAASFIRLLSIQKNRTRGWICCLDNYKGNAIDIKKLEIEQRNQYIKRLKGKGLSIRQISRLTGISKGIVERIN